MDKGGTRDKGGGNCSGPGADEQGMSAGPNMLRRPSPQEFSGHWVWGVMGGDEQGEHLEGAHSQAHVRLHAFVALRVTLCYTQNATR